MAEQPDLVERFAGETHQVWSDWMRYMFGKGEYRPDGTWIMPAWAWERWTRQMNTPYAELSEAEKQSDRDVFQKYYGGLIADLAAVRARIAEQENKEKEQIFNVIFFTEMMARGVNELRAINEQNDKAIMFLENMVNWQDDENLPEPPETS